MENRLSKWDALKIKSVFLYVLNKLEKEGYYKVFKIIYFANKAHLKTYGKPIIADTFHALENGPVPTFLYDAVKHSIGKSAPDQPFIAILDGCIGLVSGKKHTLMPLEKCDEEELSGTNIKCLDASIEENKDLTFGQLADKSHDSAWNKAYYMPGSSSINMIDIAKAAGVDASVLDYMKEHQEFDNLMNPAV